MLNTISPNADASHVIRNTTVNERYPKEPTTFEAAEPTCVNCNEEESAGHCDSCEGCILSQVLYEGSWICNSCLSEELEADITD